MTDDTPTFDDTGIAIIGMAGRFPGAANLEEFWENLRGGVESLSVFTDEELIAAGVDPELINNPRYVKARGLVEGADRFDAAFFGYTPREAEVMDPQQRILLESAYSALENAGYDPQACEMPVGVFTGGGFNTYLLDNVNSERMRSSSGAELLLGADKDFFSTRVSYKLNLKGPSITVQTACSTSLVAVTQACQSLLTYQCDMALAGGVSVHAPRISGYLYQEEGINSPDGHCRSFDADARGTVSAEGVGVVVLKRLADAIEDGDTIDAVIMAAAINNDGSDKVGFTAPSVEGQAQVIAMAHSLAGVDADSISYVEAHGTATSLGDPVEIAALTQAFAATTDHKGYCAIGSLKSNFGHADAAAGVGGLIKTVLAMKHHEIPPSLHYKTPNPRIDFADSPFFVNTKLSEWKQGSTSRRAGVSSFGIGGTNAHIVLEEAPLIEESSTSRKEQLLVLSARTKTALSQTTVNLADALKRQPTLNLADVAYTLQVGRRRFRHRRILTCRTTTEAVAALESSDLAQVAAIDQEILERPVSFMFPGQGSQYVGMGKGLYLSEELFRDLVDHCCNLLEPELGCDLREILFPADAEADSPSERIDQTLFTQPALFVIEYALARLWMAWGVNPQAMIGHSIGEYVAACISGVISLEDALTLVAARAKLMQELPAGAMLAVPLSPAELEQRLDKAVSVAAVNEPGLSIVSGQTESIARLEQQLEQDNIHATRLHTTRAFHSAMMDPVLESFTQVVQSVTLNPPSIPYLSNVSGTWITDSEAQDPAYYARHLRQTVKFAEGIRNLLEDPERLLLEVGPGTTLVSLAGRHPGRGSGHAMVASMRHPKDPNPELSAAQKALGQLWLQGVDIDWTSYYGHESRHRVPLPSYPFEGQAYWIDSGVRTREVPGLATSAYQQRENLENWFYVPSWKRVPLSVSSSTISESENSSRWLVFANGSGFGQRLVKQLAEQDQMVSMVNIGKEAKCTDSGDYTLDPAKPEHYRLLVDVLQGDGSPLNIVHLWGVSGGDNDPVNLTSSELLDRCFYSPINIAQAIGEQNLSFPVHLTLVTDQLQDVVGGEVLVEHKAGVLGPCKVIPQEYPQITCHSVDIQLPETGTLREREQIQALIAETRFDNPDSTVAYRGPHRWVQTFEQVALGEVQGVPGRLRNQGVYLITGGLGGIGLELARYLAETISARLVLVSRSELPEPEKWSEWLAAHTNGDATSNKIRGIQAMQEAGAQIAVFSADVADSRQMKTVIDQAEAKFGAVNGVIHAAGIAGGGVVQLKTREAASSVLEPKLSGLQVLDELFGESNLDFMVLCSSLTAITGGAGQVDYTAANACLDTFAQRKGRDADTFTVSINWDAWSEVGMAVDTDLPAELEQDRRRILENGLSNEEGVEVFARILSGSSSQVAVSTTAFSARIEALQSRAEIEEHGKPEAKACPIENQAYARPGLSTEYVAPRSELEQSISRVWGEFIGVDRVGINDNFFELGGHSLLAIQIITQIATEMQTDLSVNTFFEAPTIAEAVVLIERTKQQQEDAEIAAVVEMVEQMTDEEVQALLEQE